MILSFVFRLSNLFNSGIHFTTINCFEESGEMKSSQTVLKNNNNKSRTILMAYTIGDEKSGFNSLLTIELNNNNSSNNKSEFKYVSSVLSSFSLLFLSYAFYYDIYYV